MSDEADFWKAKYKTVRAVHMYRMRDFRRMEKVSLKDKQRLAELRQRYQAAEDLLLQWKRAENAAADITCKCIDPREHVRADIEKRLSEIRKQGEKI